MKTRMVLTIVFFIASHMVQADQLTRLTDFGLPRSSNPTGLVDVNGTLFFFVPTDSGYQSELWRSDGTAAGTFRVKSKLPRSLESGANVNGTLFFGGPGGKYVQGISQNELWKSDGTEAGTVLVKQILPAPHVVQGIWDGPNLGAFLNVNGTLFFAAKDGVHGLELWKSDGTEVGTVLVKDIYPGVGNSDPSLLVNVNGTLFFAADDGVHGWELWKSDGTEAGTALVKDIYPGPTGSIREAPVEVNGKVFFRAYDGVHGRASVWASDGTAAGTVLVRNCGWFWPSPSSLLNVNGTLFFGLANSESFQLWKSDGTQAGTVLVKDIGSPMSPFVDVNGTLFFAVYASSYESGGTNKSALWKSDGTPAGTVLVKETNLSVSADWLAHEREQTADEDPFWLLNVNRTLFFRVSDGEHGSELWKSDGTAAGTVLVKDIAPGLPSSFPFEQTTVKDTLFFVANDPLTGKELWKSDGTEAGTVLVKEVYPGTGSSSASGLLNVNGTLFFNATDLAHGAELWKSDGTVAGTTLVKDINPGAEGSNPGAREVFSPQFAEINGTLFFGADGGAARGRGLWKSDGTEAGTVFVRDIYPYRLLNANGTLFFAGQNPNGAPIFGEWPRVGSKLWKSDGTQAGTILVKDIRLGDPGYGDFTEFENVNGTLFFTSSGNGLELWKSDGTTLGTVLIKEFSGQGGSYHQLLNVNGTLFIGGLGGLWKSDGTAAGTVLLNGENAHDLVNVNGTLFFGGNEALLKSDGTAAGTVLVKAIPPGPTRPGPFLLANVNGTLFFFAGDRMGELWKSDGTAEGTVLVKKAGQEGPFYPYQLLDVNGTLFFNAADASHGYELWKSDGTESGTLMVKDIYPGVGDSLPSRLPFLYANGALFFPADDGEHGVQLWKYVPDPVANGRPVLKIARNPGQLVLSWTADGSGYTMEATSDLGSSFNGSNTSGMPAVVGNQYTFTNTMTNSRQFFRLRK